MKRSLARCALIMFAIALLAACNSPQPLPVAPTKIPSLPPATLPPAVTATPRAGVAGVTFPKAPVSAVAGEAIYKAKCVSCHGADGKAQVASARNFTDVDYMKGAVPAVFYAAVTKGKETMPGFEKELSDQERWDATLYLWSFAVPNATLAKGKAIYETNCVSCHGPTGSGVIPQAAALNDFQYMATRSVSEYYLAVSSGKGIMPPWQDRLSAEERWAAVEYAQSLAYKPLGK